MDESLVSRVLTAELFRDVPPAWVRAHLADLRRFTVAEGETIIDQGDAAREVFVVLSGGVVASHRDGDGAERRLSSMGVGETFGEIALLAGGVRTSVVRAERDSEVVALSEPGFRQLLADHPGLAARLTTAAAVRLQQTTVVADALAYLGLTDRQAVSDVEPLIEWMQLASGDVLFDEGEVGDSAYVVLHGRLQAIAGRGADERILGDIGRGELVGEMAVLDHEPRNATVFAVRDTHLARFPPAAIDLLVERHPQVVLHLARTVLGRIRRPRPARRTEEQRSITVVPLGGIGSAQAFAAELAATLARFGSSEHLSSSRVDALLGEERIAQSADTDPGSLRLLPWLHQLEERSRFVVYEADAEPSPWTRRVLRQCDQVLFVLEPGHPPEIDALEQQTRNVLVGRGRPRTAFVLLHAPSARMPRGTAAWLHHRSADDVHHVRIGDPADLGRLARILAGRGVGLVLSGGAARGFAHLGVLRALHDLNIPVDLVGGSSIGAVIGMLPALETPVEDMTGIIAEQFDQVFDYRLPVASLISGRRIEEALRSELGDLGIEDLWLPYFCVSASLGRASCVVHRRGSLATAVRASVSIPGLMPPVPVDGDLLVDGGIVDNLPTGPMRQLNPRGVVIAADVAPATDLGRPGDHGESGSSWGALWSSMRRKGSVPPLAQTVWRSMLVAAARDRERAAPDHGSDLYLDLEVDDCGPFDFDAVAPTAEAGYQAARPRLEAWLAARGLPG